MPATTNFTSGDQHARKFGVHQVTLSGPADLPNPFLPVAQVKFTAPSGAAVTVDAFYDGADVWRARVYVTEAGDWTWQAQPLPGAAFPPAAGAFSAEVSSLPGRLLVHPQAATHWVREDGQSFLNFNDTAYHLFRPSEALWQEYVRDAVALGVTSLRVGALGGPAWSSAGQGDRGEGVTYPWQGDDTARFQLEAFHTSEERLIWLLDQYPDLYIQLIMFGQIEAGRDYTGQAWLAISPLDRENTMRYLLARWAAFPQVFWLIVNDLFCTEEYPNNQLFVREVGRYVAAHDPWQHPLSAGPRRKMVFPFHPSSDPWVSYVHIEDQYDLNAAAFWRYADWGMPVFLGEDRYEHDRATRDPLRADFVFRCLFTTWLLAGSSASYGGRWRTLTPYTHTGQTTYSTGWGGADEITYTQPLRGLDSLPHLHAYFIQRGIELWQFRPDNARVTSPDPADAALPPKMTRRAWAEILMYHPNATGDDRFVRPDPERSACLEVDLSPSPNAYLAEWFRPSTGESMEGGVFLGGAPVMLTAPWQGCDVILRLLSTC